jgi:type VI secretion system secreted protein VgrG
MPAMNPLVDLLTGAAGWNQNARLLTLHTPLGADVLLAETAIIDEALGPVAEHAGLRIELTVLATNAHLALNTMLGQPVRLDLQTVASRPAGSTLWVRSELRPFHSHITAASRLGANGGFARYRLIIEPWLAFLGHNRDHYLFQEMSVIDIVDEVLTDWKSQGKLAPDWRWDLADRAAYPKRGMTVQYAESDLAFLKRLLAEEGLFCWFEHRAEEGETLGQHTLVIADHNGAFKPNSQPRIRYTQAGATLSEDSLDRWHGERRLDTAESQASSWDYRSLSSRPQGASTTIANAPKEVPLGDGTIPSTVAWHDPGQYAWQSSAHGERMLTNQRQAIDARMKHYRAEGTVRSAAPGSTFHLADHPDHPLGQGEGDHFLITAIRHGARNNLAEQLPAALDVLGPPPDDGLPEYYRNQFTALRATTPWKPLLTDTHGRHIHPRPTASGTLTGIVVGDGSPTHTDRDGRIRVEFPWQRGARSASRNPHPSGADNAPASAALGVWLRVMAPVAGANWGGHLIPRPGQEVLVAFQNGNIDRPLVIGSVYNGQGNDDAQGNRIAGSPLDASANAPAFFAGKADPAHSHGASLSGLKSQQLANSRDGQGGHNQLVFDDTPGEARLDLATSQYQSQLQLGHLKEQHDNARHKDRGHGGELATQASLAIRAGNGLLISTDARQNASSNQLDSREAIAGLEAAQSLTNSLADLAKKQNAALTGDPDELPVSQSLQHALDVLQATTSQSAKAAGTGDIKATQGGTGTIPAWSEPRLQTSAPAGLAQLTPNHHLLVSGKNTTVASGHDSQIISQGNHSLAIKDGLALFTHGKSKNANKPNQETGIHLHAASGQVSLQVQSGKLIAAADKKMTLASTHASLTASAKQKIIATAQGAYLKIEGGNIEVHAPGKVLFKASKKEWTGPKSSSSSGSLAKAGEVKGCAPSLKQAASEQSAVVDLD